MNKAILYCKTLTVFSFAALMMTESKADSSQACSQYVKGFIDGALVTDNSIVENLTKDYEGQGQSEFFQRAFKTRVGSRYQMLPATYYAGFCFPENEELEVTAAKVSKGYCSSDNVALNSEAIFTYLQSHYPCNKKAD